MPSMSEIDSAELEPFYQNTFEILEDILRCSRKTTELCETAARRMKTLAEAEQALIVHRPVASGNEGGYDFCGFPREQVARIEKIPAFREKHLAEIRALKRITIKRFTLETGAETKSACGIPLLNAAGENLGAVFLVGLSETTDNEDFLNRRLIFLVRYFSEIFSSALLRERQEELIAQRTEALWQEIEERKSVERVLRKSRDEWEETFNALPDLVTLQDPQMTIIKANRLACEVLGMDQSEIIGQKCYEIFGDHGEVCPECPIWNSTNNRPSHANVITHQRLRRTFLVNTSPIFDDKGQVEYIVHAAKDITEQRRLEEELLQSQKMEAIGTLAGGIAHDFNNILSAIIGYSEIIKMGLPEGSTLTEDANEVIRAGKRAAELVKQILTFSRKDSAAIEVFEPHLILAESLKMLRSSLPTSIEITGEIRKDCGYIRANPTSIHQIMMNLCTNALHAMENEKGVLTVDLRRVELDQEFVKDVKARPGAYVLLSVADTGRGMPKEVLDRIFEPYYSTKEIERGTGLGLAVVHGIVCDSGGFVRVDSTEGQGSRFDLYLPAEELPPATKHASLEEEIPTGSEHILIVDDENAVTQVNRALLENLGYRTTTEGDSLRALDMIQVAPERFDLLLTDQTMPGLTGSELARAVLEIRPDMPIILCTGYSSVISEEDALALGIRRYLLKPVGREDLARNVRSALDD